MYARRKGWPLAAVEVDVRHDRVHAADCAECEAPDSVVDRFQRVVRVEGDLDEQLRARLLEIAEKCPVHRTLENAITVETTLGSLAR
jgi:putative redox protein